MISPSPSASSVSLFFILLLLSHDHLFTNQTYALRALLIQGSDIKRKRELASAVVDLGQEYSSEVDDEGGGDIQRKELHEVHSGPNPIGNSIPPQWRKTKFETNS